MEFTKCHDKKQSAFRKSSRSHLASFAEINHLVPLIPAHPGELLHLRLLPHLGLHDDLEEERSLTLPSSSILLAAFLTPPHSCRSHGLELLQEKECE